MKTYVLLLRGVMPTGKNKVPMAHLREILAADGFSSVRTYIASGNAFVDSVDSAEVVASRVHVLIKTHIGADIVVVARTHADIRRVIDENPFNSVADTSRLFFAFFAEPLDREKIHALNTQDFGDEKLHITKHAAYMYIPGLFGRGKLSGTFLEKKFGVAATVRNFNTIYKVAALSESSPAA